MSTKKTIISYLIAAFCIGLLFSCNTYEWDSDIKKMTDGDLKEWLRKAPFDDLWDIYQEKNTYTNIKEVFPLYRGFTNKEGKIISKDSIYQDEIFVIKDSLGDGYVYAALLDANQKIHLKSSYYTIGNVLFEGTDSHKNSHEATLRTLFKGNNPDNISKIYNVNIRHNYSSINYILCHYYKNRFLMQVLFVHDPKYNQDKSMFEYDYAYIINKIKSINKSMNLQNQDWENITAEDLVFD